MPVRWLSRPILCNVFVLWLAFLGVVVSTQVGPRMAVRKLPATENVGGMVRNGEVSHILASWMSNTATYLGGWRPTFGGQLGGCSHLHYIPEHARTCRCRSGARHPLWTISDPGKASGPFFAFSWTWVEKDCATGGGFAMTGRLMVCDGSRARRRHSDCHGPSSLGGGEGSGRERSGSGPAFHGSVDVCWGRVPFGGETCDLPGLSRGGRPSGIESVLWTGSRRSL